MSLPIVENSVMHGLDTMSQDSTIYLKCFVDDDVFYIEISDSGKGMTEEELNAVIEAMSNRIFPDSPEDAQKALELICGYLNSELELYSTSRLGEQMKQMHTSILEQEMKRGETYTFLALSRLPAVAAQSFPVSVRRKVDN